MTDNIFGNVTNAPELRVKLIQAFEELDRILSDHSGPFATNALIGSRWRQINDVDEFSKDGIKILLHLIVSEDPCARLAAREARFVGLRVDARCHDGTTTSMLAFCRLACIALKHMDAEYLSADRYTWARGVEEVLDFCLERIADFKITEEILLASCQSRGMDTKPEEVRAAIAYHMAMISSKGDRDLAWKISEIIKSSPKTIYGMFKDSPLAIETKEKYILEKQAYDLAISANLGNVQDYNYKSDTQYLSENAVIFSTANEVVIDSWESLFLTSFISTKANKRVNLSEFGDTKGWEEYHGGIKNLLILTPMLSDPELIQAIKDFNNQNPTIKISWFNTHCHPRMRTSLDKTIHYMAGSYLFSDVMMDPVLCLVGLDGPALKAHLLGNTLTLSNLYEKDEEVYHLFYREPDLFKPYTDFVKETEELIEFAQANVTNQALDHDEVTYLISLYRALTTQTIYDIKIGGSSHDQYANRTVYEDAIGAALSAVNEGVVLGGYGHLYNLCRARKGVLSHLFAGAFLRIVEDSLRHNPTDPYVSDKLANALVTPWTYLAADPKGYNAEAEPFHYLTVGDLELQLPYFISRTQGSPILLQAYAGFEEQLKRCRDILPRLSETTHLVDMRLNPADAASVR